MNNNQTIKLHSDEGTLWFSCDYDCDEKEYINFDSYGITFMDGLIGIESRVSYEDGEEITIELLNEKDETINNFIFLGSINMDTDKSGILRVGWLESLDDDYYFNITKAKNIVMDFWINDAKDYIKLHIK